MVKLISHNGKELSLHKSIKGPNFEGKTVLVDDPWEFVEMWLNRNSHSEDAIFYWQQSRHFYNATLNLPLTSAPLTLYYCFLNAVKALLIVKKVRFSDRHGVSGWGKKGRGVKTTLSNEFIRFQKDGVLAALCRYLDESIETVEEYTLKDILYNLPFIHRAYGLTYISDSTRELFIPINNNFFIRKNKSNESWFSAEIDPKYANGHTLRKITDKFEKDVNFSDQFIVRYKRRFKWNSKDENRLKKLANYHRKLRRDICYIAGSSRLWYIKRDETKGVINKNTMVLCYAAMHRLSELSRYQPVIMSKHLSSNQNWLLSEFIRNSALQFIDELSSELTGEEFMIPGISSRPSIL